MAYDGGMVMRRHSFYGDRTAGLSVSSSSPTGLTPSLWGQVCDDDDNGEGLAKSDYDNGDGDGDGDGDGEDPAESDYGEKQGKIPT